MPITPPVTIENQIQPNIGVLPYVQQMNFGQMIGTISAYNPNAIAQIPTWINESVWALYDKKTWYGLWALGQISCPQAVSGGTATATLGSQTVQGNGTSWDQTLIGRQFRLGLTCPPYTITDVNPFTQQLTLALPYSAPVPPNQTTQTGGYFIVKMWYSLGPNIKYVKQIVNFQLGFKLRLNMTQDFFDNADAWRITENFPFAAAPLPADPNGNYMLELWPAPFTQQVLPWRGYILPPLLKNDTDSLPPYIRCDVINKDVIARALRYKPKDNPGYDPQTALAVAKDFDEKFQIAVLDMANADENLYRTSATIPGEDLPYYTPGGNTWAAMHAVMAGGADDGW